MTVCLPDDADAPQEVMWEGRFVTAYRRGRWEYVGRSRGIHAAVVLAVDAEDHVILVDQYRVPLGRRCIELPIDNRSLGKGGTGRHRRLSKAEIKSAYEGMTQSEYFAKFGGTPGELYQPIHDLQAMGRTNLRRL